LKRETISHWNIWSSSHGVSVSISAAPDGHLSVADGRRHDSCGRIATGTPNAPLAEI